MAKQAESKPTFEAETLRQIERSLHGKLRAHRVSEEFIRRFGEDALQQGFAEYARALTRGGKIDNAEAWIVRASFCRAIDEVRREARRSDGSAEVFIEAGRLASPPTEVIALEYLEAERLHKAIRLLSAEEQRLLCLHYFEEKSAEASARILYCSERTYRRRLAKTLAKLGRVLGAPVPEPGSELAIEIGLAAWVTLQGASVVLSSHPFEHLVAAADDLRHGAMSLGRNLREILARTFTPDTAERISAMAGGPAGKVAGSCAGALTLCTLTGVVGPGVGGINVIDGGLSRAVPAQQAKPHAHPKGYLPNGRSTVIAPVNRSAASQPASDAQPRSGHQSAARKQRLIRRAERRQVERQASGFARAGSESFPTPTGGAASSTASQEVEASAPPPSEAASTPAVEAEQANQEFGAFK